MKYYQKCVKFACNYFKSSSASGDFFPRRPTFRLLPRLRPWTPLGDSRPLDPYGFAPPPIPNLPPATQVEGLNTADREAEWTDTSCACITSRSALVVSVGRLQQGRAGTVLRQVVLYSGSIWLSSRHHLRLQAPTPARLADRPTSFHRPPPPSAVHAAPPPPRHRQVRQCCSVQLPPRGGATAVAVHSHRLAYRAARICYEFPLGPIHYLADLQRCGYIVSCIDGPSTAKRRVL